MQSPSGADVVAEDAEDETATAGSRGLRVLLLFNELAINERVVLGSSQLQYSQ